MRGNVTDQASAAGATCGAGGDGLRCAVIAWAAPLAAVVLLALGMRFPLLKVFNIFFVAFGVTALARSVAHIRRHGSSGLGGHVAVGVVLNVAVLILVIVYVFTRLDPLSLRAG